LQEKMKEKEKEEEEKAGFCAHGQTKYET